MHFVFRDAVANAGDYLGSAPTAPARVEMVASYYANVLSLLDVHHDSEDTLINPLLLERCTEAEAAQVAAVGAQHQPVHDRLESARSAVAAWSADPSAEAAADAAGVMTALGDPLVEHLDEEERTMVPLGARYLNAAEWGAMPSHGMANFRGDKLWLILGLIQEQMSPEQIVTMESHMPPPVAAMWNGHGRAAFTEFVSALRS
jgi:hypothetical protein